MQVDINEKKSSLQLISIVIEGNEEGYLARIPNIQGAFAEGDTPQEAIFNCLDVLSIIIEYRKQMIQPLEVGNLDINLDTGLTVTLPVQLSL